MVTTMMVMAAVSVVVVTLLLFILQLPFLQVLLLNSVVSMPTAAAADGLALAGNKEESLLNHGLAFCSAFCAGAAFLATLLAPLGHVP